MQFFYSPSSGGFYTPDIHGENMPKDVCEVSSERHAELMAGQAGGMKIGADSNGRPNLQERDKPTNDQLAAEARAKRVALLKDSDWVTLRAVETGSTVPTEWAAYRQALRDVPKQKAFPKSITWPAVPK